jgi:hypothetical protein
MSQSAAYIKEINSTAVSLCLFVTDSGDITTWAPGINIDMKTSKEDNPKFIYLDQGTKEQISEFFIKNENREYCFDVLGDEWK